MTDVRTPRVSIPINSPGQVKTTNPDGLIDKTTWEATEGLRRQEEIERARIEALKQYEQQQQDNHPLAKRMCALETEVKTLRSQLETFTGLLKDKLNGG